MHTYKSAACLCAHLRTPIRICTHLKTPAHPCTRLTRLRTPARLRHQHTPSRTRTRLHTPVCTLLTPACLCVQARSLQAVPRLVKLFNHANQEVQRHATGAMRNLIYDNADNKLALVEENGIFELLRTLREHDDELRKNVTGALPAHASPLPPSLRSLFLCPRHFRRPRPFSCHRSAASLQPPGPVSPGTVSRLCHSPVTCRLRAGSLHGALERGSKRQEGPWERLGASSPPSLEGTSGRLLTMAMPRLPQGSCGTCPPATI